jgi:type I restriction enzyme, S subunit
VTYSGNCRLGDLFQSRRERGRPGLPLLSVTMNDGLVDRDDLERKQDTTLSPEEHLLVKPGDIAYNTMRMWQGAFGLADREGLVSPAYVVLAPRPNVDSRYVAQALQTPRMRHLLWSYSHGLTEDRLRLYFDDFAAIPMFVPSLGEQQRLAQVLTTWDDAISVALRLLARTVEMSGAIGRRLIGSVNDSGKVLLCEVAEVRTGIAKGKIGQRDVVRLPYLRVANVQDGRLDLREVKQIDVARDQVERYSLHRGDILLTEGGDFDKLGRGAVWHGEVEPCLHQNHVFAVRPNTARVDPEFLSALVASEYGRTYFLGCAKRSTNLASINSSQLKAFPIPLPPLARQREISTILGAWTQAVTATERRLAHLNREKAALMAELLTGKRRSCVATGEVAR